jgi:hypothetical protein
MASQTFAINQLDGWAKRKPLGTIRVRELCVADTASCCISLPYPMTVLWLLLRMLLLLLLLAMMSVLLPARCAVILQLT